MYGNQSPIPELVDVVLYIHKCQDVSRMNYDTNEESEEKNLIWAKIHVKGYTLVLSHPEIVFM